jgi:hypothetical protein
MLAKCHVGKLSVGELSGWLNVMLANCQLVNCHVGELSHWGSCQNVMLAKCKK